MKRFSINVLIVELFSIGFLLVMPTVCLSEQAQTNKQVKPTSESNAVKIFKEYYGALGRASSRRECAEIEKRYGTKAVRDRLSKGEDRFVLDPERIKLDGVEDLKLVREEQIGDKKHLRFHIKGDEYHVLGVTLIKEDGIWKIDRWRRYTVEAPLYLN
jgi:hypothetical protein